MAKTLPSNAEGVGLIPGRRAKIPHALQPKNQNIKQKQYCYKFIKTLKMVHIKIILKKNKPTLNSTVEFQCIYLLFIVTEIFVATKSGKRIT